MVFAISSTLIWIRWSFHFSFGFLLTFFFFFLLFFFLLLLLLFFLLS